MRTVVSRLLLVSLVIVAALAIGRVALGVGGGAGIVDLGRLRPDALAHDAFRVGAPSRVAIDAAGSFEEAGPGADTTLAAYGWIVRRADGAVVWRMQSARPERGLYVTARDTVALDPGDYDVYFTSLGDPLVRTVDAGDGSLTDRFRAALSRGGRSWHGDAGRWRFRVDAVSGRIDQILGSNEDPAAALVEVTVPDRVWSSGAVRSGETRETLFQVAEPTTVRVRALFEAYDGVVADSASIVRLADRDTVWTARAADSAWAGGSVKNRQTEARVALAPGLYRAVYHTDRTHAYRDWAANPPFAPWQWGMEVQADALGAVVVVDPAQLDLPIVAEIQCVGPSAKREERISLPARTDVILLAVGEVIGGSVFDFASLDRVSGTGGTVRLWTMEAGATEPAGGASKNRRVLASLSLDAGTYVLRYETDDSHDCTTFNDSRPTSPDLWGAVLYAADPAFDPTTVGRLGSTGAGARREGEPDGLSGDGDRPRTLVQIDRVENDTDREETFTLGTPAVVRVVALGEMMPDERQDWGWIEDADGETVWEMTHSNTWPAGGDARNRRHNGILTLGAGTYTVHYRTNGTHAFQDFDSASRPPDPEDWGLRVDWVAANSDR